MSQTNCELWPTNRTCFTPTAAVVGVLDGVANSLTAVTHSGATQCATDIFSVSSPGGTSPPSICGTNTGEHSMKFKSFLRISKLAYASLLKYGFCKKLLLFECNSDQLNISWPFLSSLLGGFGVALLLHPPKSDDKNVQEMFNWSEFHSERNNFLQNPYL